MKPSFDLTESLVSQALLNLYHRLTHSSNLWLILPSLKIQKLNRFSTKKAKFSNQPILPIGTILIKIILKKSHLIKDILVVNIRQSSDTNN